MVGSGHGEIVATDSMIILVGKMVVLITFKSEYEYSILVETSI